jgi:hypothetical protein
MDEMTIRSEMLRLGSIAGRLALAISATALALACGGEGNTTLTPPASDAAADAKAGDGAAPDGGSFAETGTDEGGTGDASPEAEPSPDAGADDVVVLGDGASD